MVTNTTGVKTLCKKRPLSKKQAEIFIKFIKLAKSGKYKKKRLRKLAKRYSFINASTLSKRRERRFYLCEKCWFYHTTSKPSKYKKLKSAKMVKCNKRPMTKEKAKGYITGNLGKGGNQTLCYYFCVDCNSYHVTSKKQ